MPSHIQNTASTPLVLSAQTFSKIAHPKAAQFSRWLVQRLNPAVLRRQEQLWEQNQTLRAQVNLARQRHGQISADLRRSEAEAATARQESERLVTENQQLQSELKTQNQSIEEVLLKASEDETARLAVTDKNQALQKQVDTLTQELERLRTLVDAEDCVSWSPRQLTQIPSWIEQYWPCRLVFSNRALHELAESRYRNVALAAEATRLLANEYYKWRKGGMGVSTDVFFQACHQNHLTYCRTPRHVGKSQRSKYTVDYEDQPRQLEHQLKSKNSWDARETLRIYFLWDKRSERVVIGNMPGHLPNRIR